MYLLRINHLHPDFYIYSKFIDYVKVMVNLVYYQLNNSTNFPCVKFYKSGQTIFALNSDIQTDKQKYLIPYS